MRLCVPGLGDPVRKAENSEGQREVEVGSRAAGVEGRPPSAQPWGSQAEAAPPWGAHSATHALYFYCIFCPHDVKEINTRP